MLTLHETGHRLVLQAAAVPGWYNAVDGVPPAREGVLTSIPGVAVDAKAKTRTWMIPENLALARPDLFEIRGTTPTVNDAILPIPSHAAGHRLLPYQHHGVRFLLQHCGTILADDVGVAKTIQAALTVQLEGHARVAVIGPLIAQGVWCDEGSDPQKMGITVRPVTGRKGVSVDAVAGASWIYVHYDVLRDWFPILTVAFRPTALIFDEAHHLKEWRTKRAVDARNLSRLRTVRRRVLLTATPIANMGDELWSLLDIAQPHAWGHSGVDYGIRYCGFSRGQYGWEPGEPTNSEELRSRLKYAVLRRTRGQVQKHLPPFDREVQPLAVDQAGDAVSHYRAVAHDVRAALQNVRTGAEKLVQMTALASTLSAAKVPAAVTEVKSRLAQHEKVFAFSWFKDSARAVAAALSAWGTTTGVEVIGPVTGDTAIAKRLAEARRFAAVRGRAVFVGTIAACNESLNDLVAGSWGIIQDLYWVPWRLLQLEGRWHRQGQVRSCGATYLHLPGTLDDQMANALHAKAQEIEAAGLGGEGIDQAEALAHAFRGEDEVDGLEALVASLLEEAS